MSQVMQYKGYTGSALFSAEDNIFHGQLPGIYDSSTYEGASVEDLRSDFETAVDGYVAGCAADGRSPDEPIFCGANVQALPPAPSVDDYATVPLALTVTPDLHQRAETFAAAQYLDVNVIMQQALQQYLDRAA